MRGHPCWLRCMGHGAAPPVWRFLCVQSRALNQTDPQSAPEERGLVTFVVTFPQHLTGSAERESLLFAQQFQNNLSIVVVKGIQFTI